MEFLVKHGFFSFFEMLANTVGKYICADENTIRGCMGVARFMVIIKCVVVLNETFNVLINGVSFESK